MCGDLYRVVDVWGSTQGDGCVGIYTGWWMCGDLYRAVDVWGSVPPALAVKMQLGTVISRKLANTSNRAGGGGGFSRFMNYKNGTSFISKT